MTQYQKREVTNMPSDYMKSGDAIEVSNFPSDYLKEGGTVVVSPATRTDIEIFMNVDSAGTTKTMYTVPASKVFYLLGTGVTSRSATETTAIFFKGTVILWKYRITASACVNYSTSAPMRFIAGETLKIQDVVTATTEFFAQGYLEDA